MMIKNKIFVSKDIPNTITQKAIVDTENNNDIYGTFDSVEELMEALNEENSN